MSQHPIFTERDNGIVLCRLESSFLNPTLPQREMTLTPGINFNLGAFGVPDITEHSEDRTFSVPYRLLSQTLVWVGGHALLDFSTGNVLKDALPLFEKVTIIYDHDHRSENWIGKLASVEWSPAFNGTAIPGVNGVIRFAMPEDTDSSDRAWILKGIRGGFVMGMSLGLRIAAERSHPDLDVYDFYSLQGKEVDGELVRFIVTAVERVLEGSVCLAGADGLAGPAQLQAASADTDPGIVATLTGGGWTFAAGTPEHNEPSSQRRTTMADPKKAPDKGAIPAQDAAPDAAVLSASAPTGLDEAQVKALLTQAQQDLSADLSAKYDAELAALKARYDLELAAQRKETEQQRLRAQRVQQLAALNDDLHRLQAGGLPKVLEAVKVSLSDEDRAALDAADLPQGEDVPVSLSVFRLSLSGWQKVWFEGFLQETAKLASMPVERVTTPGKQAEPDVLVAYMAFKDAHKETFSDAEMYDRFLAAHPEYKAVKPQGGTV